MVQKCITFIVTIAVVGITIGISIYCLATNSGSGNQGITFIGQSLLPLWGTWFGTILAFYFGKANFEAATKSYQEVINKLTTEEKIANIPVKEVMIPFDKIEYLDYDKEINNSIKSILDYERFSKYGRYAIFDKKHLLKYIIHKSTFNRYIVEKLDSGKDKESIFKTTLQDFINDIVSSESDLKSQILKGANFVSIDSNLLDAKKAINAIPECQDVFITATGKSTEPVLGLITNNMILENEKEK